MDTSITLIGVRLLLQSQLKLATSTAGAVAGSLKVGCMPHRAQLRAQLLIEYRMHLYLCRQGGEAAGQSVAEGGVFLQNPHLHAILGMARAGGDDAGVAACHLLLGLFSLPIGPTSCEALAPEIQALLSKWSAWR